MLKSLPLFYYPTRWLWVDDDFNLLKTSVRVHGSLRPIVPFNHPRECLGFLQRYQSPLAGKKFLQASIDNEYYGTLRSMPVDFDITSLAELEKNSERHNEICGIVIDYGMPEINGLALAQAIKSFSFKKILLTGEAENSDAIIAFNDNLIDRFVRKGEPKTSSLLKNYLMQLTIKFFQEKTAGLLNYLETEGAVPITDPIFINFFQEHCEKNLIKEYYLLDRYGSFMLINLSGEKSYLCVHTEKSLTDLLELYSDVEKNTSLLAIQNRSKIPFFGVGKEGWEIDHNGWSDYLHDAVLLNGREKYYWSVVKELPEKPFNTRIKVTGNNII